MASAPAVAAACVAMAVSQAQAQAPALCGCQFGRGGFLILVPKGGIVCVFVFMIVIVLSASAGNRSSEVFVRGFSGCPKVNCVRHGVKRGDLRMSVVP